MSLIIDTKDLKGTDMEAKERKEHGQRQAKSTANSREKQKADPTSEEEHTQSQGHSSTKGHRAETWRSQMQEPKSMFWGEGGTNATPDELRHRSLARRA